MDGSRDRVPELDLMRFIAASTVVMYHFLVLPPAVTSMQQALKTVVQFGWLGVPLFFMISGFVILWTAQTKTRYEFTISRITRLYPSFWLGVLLTAWITHEHRAWVILANLTMEPAMLHAPRIDDVYWTLEIEIFFYALVFVLMPRKHVEGWLLAWSVATTVNLFYPLHVALGGWAAFFISGALLYLIYSRGLTRLRLLSLAGSAALCAVQILRVGGGFMPATTATLWTAAAVILLWHLMMLGVANGIRIPVKAYWLGSLTYPLYLVHNMIGKTVYRALHFNPWVNVLCAITVVFLMAIVMAALIEQRLSPGIHRTLKTWGVPNRRWRTR